MRETALPSCLGSALHTGERREGEGDSIDTTLKVTQCFTVKLLTVTVTLSTIIKRTGTKLQPNIGTAKSP